MMRKAKHLRRTDSSWSWWVSSPWDTCRCAAQEYSAPPLLCSPRLRSFHSPLWGKNDRMSMIAFQQGLPYARSLISPRKQKNYWVGSSLWPLFLDGSVRHGSCLQDDKNKWPRFVKFSADRYSWSKAAGTCTTQESKVSWKHWWQWFRHPTQLWTKKGFMQPHLTDRTAPSIHLTQDWPLIKNVSDWLPG